MIQQTLEMQGGVAFTKDLAVPSGSATGRRDGEHTRAHLRILERRGGDGDRPTCEPPRGRF
ncbi:hypothetical protein D8I30_06845 [Brevundimonas naejangsanensis]|uniref:Uncharacterized protein n=1 Tax=Brevundimonas naejangsanensis TaxID=588932 RepID=A0A494RF35_9CAUL|nr:hypothetical protein D8I30_06845 [Brevundimonas naejangsanensis]